MDDFVQKIIKEFPVNLQLSDMVMTPAFNTLFDIGNGKLLGKEESDDYHTFVAKNLFLC